VNNEKAVLERLNGVFEKALALHITEEGVRQSAKEMELREQELADQRTQNENNQADIRAGVALQLQYELRSRWIDTRTREGILGLGRREEYVPTTAASNDFLIALRRGPEGLLRTHVEAMLAARGIPPGELILLKTFSQKLWQI
jgi:hypothetical protein